MQDNTITWDDIKNDSNAVQVLDKGFVYLKSVYGEDSTVCEAARISYGKGTKTVSDDRKLIRYLLNHDHTSPLEQVSATFILKLPMFVLSQLIRHRTLKANIYSGRYSIMPDEYFIPDNVNYQSTDNKQGRGETVDTKTSMLWKDGYEDCIEKCTDHYKDAIKDNVSREQARIVLHASQYTIGIFQCDLHNTMHFLKLRMDPHAQKEIRDYANAMYNLLKPKFPLCMEAFDDYKLHAKKFSRMEVNLLKSILTPTFYNVHIEQKAKELGLTQREIVEFLNKLQ